MTKSLLDLGNRDCRFPMWPNGDKPDGDAQFCGCRTDLGQSYCPEHRAVALVAVPGPVNLKKAKPFFQNTKGMRKGRANG